MDNVLNSEDPEEWLTETKQDRFETFESTEVVGDHCDSCQYNPDPLIKRGSLDADLMVVGSFPSMEDFENDRPFSGTIGGLLDEMLGAIDCSPDEDCYLTNAILCGGPDERPIDESVEACRVNVNRQIELVSPEVVLGVGKYAYCSLYHQPVDVAFKDNLGYHGSLPDHPWLDGIVTIHPGMIARSEAGSEEHTRLKRLAWKHLQKVEELLEDSSEESVESTADDPEEE